MLTLEEAKNITALAQEFKTLRREKSAKAVGVRKDLQDAVVSALIRETVERATRQLQFIDEATA